MPYHPHRREEESRRQIHVLPATRPPTKRRRRTRRHRGGRRKTEASSAAASAAESVGSSGGGVAVPSNSNSRSNSRSPPAVNEQRTLRLVAASEEEEKGGAKGSSGRVTREVLWVDGKCYGEVAVKRCLRTEDVHQMREMMEDLAREQIVSEAVRGVMKGSERSETLHLRHHVSRPLYVPREAALIMEYFGGGTLNDALAKDASTRRRAFERDIARTRVIQWMLPVFGAVHELHSRVGVGHCDLKGNNVCLTEEGVAKVIDFGRARGLDEGVDHNEDGTCAKGRAALSYYLVREDAPTFPEEEDVFGLGVMLFHVLVGEALVLRGPMMRALERASERLQREDPQSRGFERRVFDLASDCVSQRCTSSREAYERLSGVLTDG